MVEAIEGKVADGKPSAGNVHPVLVSGQDSSGNSQALQVATDGGLTVDLNAGTNAIGKLAANSGVDIGDVTINNAAGAAAVIVQGAAADGATKAGNPVLVAGEDGTNAQTLKADSDGHLQVDVLGSAGDHTIVGKAADGAAETGNPVLMAGSDGTNAETLKTDSDGHLQVDVLTATGGVTNTDSTLYASQATNGSHNISDQTNLYHKGVVIVIDVTAITSSPSVLFTVQGKALVGGYYDILVSPAVVGTGETILSVYGGMTEAANSRSGHPLPKIWRVEAVHANGDSITYSIDACVVK